MLASQSQEPCKSCRIEIEKVAELGSFDDPVARSTAVLVARMQNQGFAMTPMIQAPQIAIYSQKGAFQRLYDRRGEGPGEMALAPSLLKVSERDTLYALSGRRLLVTDRAFTRPRTLTLDFPLQDFLPLPDGRLIVNAVLERNAGHSFALHILDQAGKLLVSIDSLTATGKPRAQVTRRPLARSTAGGFWAAHVNSSEIDLYSLSGNQTRTVRVNRPWFTPWAENPGSSLEFRPLPKTASVREWPNNQLLLLTIVADAKWKPSKARVVSSSFVADDIVDTMVEVVDSRTGEVIAARRFPNSLQAVSGANDLALSTRETREGDVVVEIWRLTLVER